MPSRLTLVLCALNFSERRPTLDDPYYYFSYNVLFDLCSGVWDRGERESSAKNGLRINRFVGPPAEAIVRRAPTPLCLLVGRQSGLSYSLLWSFLSFSTALAHRRHSATIHFLLVSPTQYMYKCSNGNYVLANKDLYIVYIHTYSKNHPNNVLVEFLATGPAGVCRASVVVTSRHKFRRAGCFVSCWSGTIRCRSVRQKNEYI